MASDVQVAIELTGAEKMQGAVEDLFKSMMDSANKMNGAMQDFMATTTGTGTGGEDPFKNLGEGAKRAGEGFGAATRPANQLREALYVLRPIVRDLGGSLGLLGNFSRIAGIGFAGLAVAGVGVLAAEMVRLGESANAALRQLQGVFESNAAGQRSFDQVREAANAMGQSYSSLLPIVQKFELMRQKFNESGFKIVDAPAKQELQSFGGSVTVIRDMMDDTTKAANKFYEAIRAGASSETQAKAAASQFADELYKTGKVTGDMIRNLRLAGIDTRTLSGILQKGATDSERLAKELDATPMGARRFIQSMDQAELSTRKFHRTLTDAWERLKEVSSEGLTGDNGLARGITSAMDLLSTGVQDFFSAFKPQRWEWFGQYLKQAMQQVWNDWADIFSVNPFNFDLWLPIINGFFADIMGLARWARDGIAELFSNIPLDLSSWVQLFETMWGQIRAGAIATWNFIKNQFANPPTPSSPAGIQGAGVPYLQFARGGLFQGRPGIDTNLAWLTHLEYIMNPAAVKKYGAHFMDMINSLQFPVRGFAEGGLNLSHATTRTAAANNQRPLVLNLPGFGSFRGSIAAPDQVVESLSRASAFEQMKQGGRSPGWRS